MGRILTIKSTAIYWLSLNLRFVMQALFIWRNLVLIKKLEGKNK